MLDDDVMCTEAFTILMARLASCSNQQDWSVQIPKAVLPKSASAQHQGQLAHFSFCLGFHEDSIPEQCLSNHYDL